MGRCGRCLLVFSLLLAVGIGILFRGPIPEGFQDAGKLRLFEGALRLLKIFENIQVAIYGLDALLVGNREFAKRLNFTVNTTGIRITDEIFDGVEVRVYQPEEVASDAAIFYMHGGGWVYGDLDGPIHLAVVHVVRSTRLTMVSVNYRLAPEHRYPTPLNDCLAAYKYFVQHAKDYGINAKRIAVMGDSAGGNLAATMSLHLRDSRYKPMPKLQILLYPATQMIDMQTPSFQEHKNDPLLSQSRVAGFTLLYSVGRSDDIGILTSNMHTSPEIKKKYASTYINHADVLRTPAPPSYIAPSNDYGNATYWEGIKHILLDPYIAPLMADDLSGLPQAYVMTCEQDVLRDDGAFYAQRLRAAGNKVTHVNVPSIHGILTFGMFEDYTTWWMGVTEYIQNEL